MSFKPRNRHILIELEISEEKDETSVLLPEGYSCKDEYILALVRDLSPDCKLDINVGDKIIAPGNIVLEIKNKGGNISLVQENYILGVYRK